MSVTREEINDLLARLDRAGSYNPYEDWLTLEQKAAFVIRQLLLELENVRQMLEQEDNHHRAPERALQSGESADANSVWGGLRPAARSRLSRAVTQIVTTGKLRRCDIMKLGEVSKIQASKDLGIIRKRLPNLMRYDRSLKCYVLTQSLER